MFFRKAGGVSWLVVFLGNPGREYENTRHNAGFLAADAMEKLMGDENLLETLASNAPKVVDRYSETKVMEQWENCFRSIL